jgi:hypothetical protein
MKMKNAAISWRLRAVMFADEVKVAEARLRAITGEDYDEACRLFATLQDLTVWKQHALSAARMAKDCADVGQKSRDRAAAVTEGPR